MKLSNLLLATSAMACPNTQPAKPAYDLENFVTSEDVQFELLMDNGKNIKISPTLANFDHF